MNKISLEEAVDILEQHGYKTLEISKMSIYKFVSAVNRHIGTVESIELIDMMEKKQKGGKKG